MNLRNEPVTFSAALTAALIATVNVLAIIFSWDEAIVAGLNLAIGAWVLVISLVVRQWVTPMTNVALTEEQLELINLGKEEAGG